MPSLHLTNPTIKRLVGKNLRIYYLIINQANQEAFFCFEGTINQEG